LSLSDDLMALLFVAEVPTPMLALCRALGEEETEVRRAMDELAARFAESGPLHIVELAGGYQLATRPEYAELVANFLRPDRNRLSRSQLEVLAVVAYRQPVTTAEIAQVRGVDSDHIVKVLLERRLVEDVGRKHTPGRPILYGTTPEFLHQFKMNTIAELPSVDLSGGA